MAAPRQDDRHENTKSRESLNDLFSCFRGFVAVERRRCSPRRSRSPSLPLTTSSRRRRARGRRRRWSPASTAWASASKAPRARPALRNPSDNSLAVGPDHIVQTVNSRMAVFTKKGKRFDTTGRVLSGPANTNAIFKDFGGPCETYNNGDAVVRYDQLAGRWLLVMPIFRRLEPPHAPYAMCYAVSAGADPLGPYYRYEFQRPLFPDYPRPAIWPDGYYVPTSTGDDVIQKHVCVVDRAKMLKGEPATEQCIVIDGVNFLNNADIDGPALPPPGAPNIMMAAGGTQLEGDPRRRRDLRVEVPRRLDGSVEDQSVGSDEDRRRAVSLSVRRPADELRAAARHRAAAGCAGRQDHAAARLPASRRARVDRRRALGGHGGGRRRRPLVRVPARPQARTVTLYQQGTYAPDAFYRWMASPAMDRSATSASATRSAARRISPASGSPAGWPTIRPVS